MPLFKSALWYRKKQAAEIRDGITLSCFVSHHAFISNVSLCVEGWSVAQGLLFMFLQLLSTNIEVFVFSQ